MKSQTRFTPLPTPPPEHCRPETGQKGRNIAGVWPTPPQEADIPDSVSEFGPPSQQCFFQVTALADNDVRAVGSRGLQNERACSSSNMDGFRRYLGYTEGIKKKKKKDWEKP